MKLLADSRVPKAGVTPISDRAILLRVNVGAGCRARVARSVRWAVSSESEAVHDLPAFRPRRESIHIEHEGRQNKLVQPRDEPAWTTRAALWVKVREAHKCQEQVLGEEDEGGR